MNNNIALPRSVFRGLVAAARTGAAIILLATLSVASFAQETTSSIQGKVTDGSSVPVSGATIVVRHVGTGRSQTVVTDADGRYRVPSLRVGGPYEVTLKGTTTYGEERIEQIFIELGEPYAVNLITRTTEIEEIVVSASQQNLIVRVGAGSTFNTENILGMANVNRDFKSIIRQDPRVTIDPTNSNAVSIAGTNSRFNSLTVDGVRQNDDFGLNNSGFPTQRSPISIDAMEQISVEVAPFDVSFGGFTGGTINAVTKSGTNDWDGSLAYYHSDQSLTGDKSEDDDIDLGEFDEDTVVLTLSGPIIKDRLWFFVGYDKFTATDVSALTYGPAGSGRPSEISGVTQQDIDDVLAVADAQYGIDAGALPDSGTDIEDEKIIVKLDWAINDDHDVTFTYQDVTGNDLNPQGSSTGSNRLGLTSNWYDKKEAMETYSGQLFSRWTDSFSTELKIASKEIVTEQNSLGGTDYAQMTIDTASGGSVRIGPDIFRHANALTNESFQVKLKGEYTMNSHRISAGYEIDQLDVFNLFVFQSEADYDFACIYAADCAESFEAGNASDFNGYRNAFTNDENDGAAAFGFNVNSLYVQDVWDMSDQLTIMYGLRYDWYTGSDKPAENPFFQARNGFSNTANLDGRSVFMPRIGITYDFLEGTRIRGGIGLFSGGNPNVWVSNSFSNDGVTIVVPDTDGNIDPACTGVTDVGTAGTTGIDPYLVDQSIQNCMFSGAGSVEATDPDFDIPSTWRFNFAVERDFDLGFLGDAWFLSFEAVISRANKAVEWEELTRSQVGIAPDGRPIYDRPSTYDVILTNVNDGSADTYSFSAAKTWDTRAGMFDLFMAYTRMNAEDINPSQSSTVTSNYGRPATLDRNNRRLSSSDFEVKDRFNGTFGWQKDFWGESTTRISGFFEYRTGQLFSYTMREADGDESVWGGHSDFARRDSQLMYVPELGGTNVIFSDDSAALVNDPAVEADFNAFIAAAGLEKYRGKIMPRNHDTTADRTRVDIRISQEIGMPGLPGIGDSQFVLFFDIENLGNLINNDWGRVEQVFFPYNFTAVDKVSINDNGQYVYGSFDNFEDGIDPASLFNLPSLYKIQLGVKFQF